MDTLPFFIQVNCSNCTLFSFVLAEQAHKGNILPTSFDVNAKRIFALFQTLSWVFLPLYSNTLDTQFYTFGIIAHTYGRLEAFKIVCVHSFNAGGQIVEFVQTFIFTKNIRNAIEKWAQKNAIGIYAHGFSTVSCKPEGAEKEYCLMQHLLSAKLLFNL